MNSPESSPANSLRRPPAAAAAAWRAYTRLSGLTRRGNGDAEVPENIADYSRLWSMPEIRRVSMRPCRVERNPLRLMRRKSRASNEAEAQNRRRAAAVWRHAALRRRWVLTVLMLTQTGAAAWSLAKIFPYSWINGLEFALLAFFSILFSWISFGFWTAVAGFFVLWKGSNRFRIDDLRADSSAPLKSTTAVLMPICNEDVERAFSGLEAIYHSLAATGSLSHFDFFVLSDTGDPEKVVEEEVAWARSCRALDGFGKIFYRHRKNNIKRKSGNIADFLRRWGANYDHMVVLDADSLMAGATLVALARLMERHANAGIIQTIPATVNRESLFARMQQFAGQAYGPMLAAGLDYWQLGESAYWGHNAILRVEAFIKHCGLSRLSGRPPLGGEIMSHDFVEAALMGRAGWEVWLACDLDGSYEEAPPTLLDELKRDRRWCQGNLQHLRLLFADGIRGGHRAIMAMGVVAYTSSLLWAAFLVLSTLAVAEKWLTLPVYFTTRHTLFPLWPQWRPELALALAGSTAVLLVLPKLLSVLLVVRARRSALFGSLPRLAASVVLEVVFSTLLAPVRMWFHAKFVVLTLLGRQIGWSSQVRTDAETRWRDAVRQHGTSTVVALAWLAGVAALHWSLVWWLLPLVLALALSVPVSVYSSRVTLGRAFRRRRLFMTPEETERPQLLAEVAEALDRPREPRPIVTAAG